MRDILVTISVIVLTFVLLAAGVLIVLNFTRGGRFDSDSRVSTQDYATVKGEYGEPWRLMSQTTRLYDYGLIPVISVIAGILIGLFAKRRRALLGCLAVVPLSALMLAAHGFATRGFLLMALYLILAWGASNSISRLLRRPQTSIPATRSAA